jgi:CRP-like cAMP-binding protein
MHPHVPSPDRQTILKAPAGRFSSAQLMPNVPDAGRPRPAGDDAPHDSVALDGSNDGTTGKDNQLLRLLRSRSPDEYERLLEGLESVALDRGDPVFEPGGPIEWVYFPEGSVASVVKVLSDKRQVEVGTAGFEGMAGLPAFLGAETTPLKCVIQVPGMARRLRSDALRAAAPSGTALNDILQRYAQYLYDQSAQSVACNRLHRVDRRCARWLLMTHDRVQGEPFEITHEYLATMLGVWRPSVSLVADGLQQAGLIHYRRGKMRITDRAGLEQEPGVQWRARA